MVLLVKINLLMKNKKNKISILQILWGKLIKFWDKVKIKNKFNKNKMLVMIKITIIIIIRKIVKINKNCNRKIKMKIQKINNNCKIKIKNIKKVGILMKNFLHFLDFF